MLLVIKDPLLAGQVEVGLEAFGDLEVERENGLLALEKMRSGEFDAVLVALDPSAPENQDFFERARLEAADRALVVFGHEALLRKLRDEKERESLFALLSTPLDPVELFRAIHRLRHRRVATRAR